MHLPLISYIFAPPHQRGSFFVIGGNVKKYEVSTESLDKWGRNGYNEANDTERSYIMDNHRIIRKSTAIFATVFMVIYVVIAFIWTLEINLVSGLVWSAAFTLPIADLAWFILSLVLYLRAKKKGDSDLLEMKARLRTAVILLAFLVLMIALLIAFFAYAISHM